MKKEYFIVGIDEAGRGPLAGHLAVAAVAATVISKSEFLISKKSQNPKIQNAKLLKNIKDSKKLSAEKREEWREIIRKNFENHCVFISHKMIDKIGIGGAVRLGVEKVLEKFSRKPDLVLMDGSLKAPKEYNQLTIIKGDEKIPLISAASVIAKTARDKKMLVLDKKYPQYGFAVHKGYGTKSHYEKIKENSLCKIHRKSFCKNIGV
ncbi:MAG: ribonuclease HII [Candidatus Pacebacteria bacterium]|nr:ribonuclease HII [Candidatus Paceibacterota bacterium]NUQ57260.1 ribonuclease HII [Candidatus Paceibacter sp.]